MFEFSYAYMLPRNLDATYEDAIQRCIDEMCSNISSDPTFKVLTDVKQDWSNNISEGQSFKMVVLSRNASYIQMITVDVVGRLENTLDTYA